MINKNCGNCGKNFSVKNYRKNTAFFCSKLCAYTDKNRSQKMRTFIINNLIPKSNETRFIKGHKQSVDSRLKMSVAKKGKTPPNKKEDVFIDCAVCYTQKKIKPAHIGRAKYCSKACANKGKDFGLTKEQKRIRESTAYKLWRLSVFERDNFTCVICFQMGGKLNADHIKRFADFPDLRLDVSNGRTLCEACHRMTDTYGNRPNKTITSKWQQVA